MGLNLAQPLLYSKWFVALDWWMMRKSLKLTSAVICMTGILLMAGCATTGNSLESRKMERRAAYDSMPADFRAAVDQGNLRAGMNEDAVYIAWGRPGQISKGGNESGEFSTWTYRGYQLEDVGYWGYRAYHPAYVTVDYTAAQVVFVKGLVKSWQTFPRP